MPPLTLPPHDTGYLSLSQSRRVQRQKNINTVQNPAWSLSDWLHHGNIECWGQTGVYSPWPPTKQSPSLPLAQNAMHPWRDQRARPVRPSPAQLRISTSFSKGERLYPNCLGVCTVCCKQTCILLCWFNSCAYSITSKTHVSKMSPPLHPFHSWALCSH